jgi:hypothetical protein
MSSTKVGGLCIQMLYCTGTYRTKIFLEPALKKNVCNVNLNGTLMKNCPLKCALRNFLNIF